MKKLVSIIFYCLIFCFHAPLFAQTKPAAKPAVKSAAKPIQKAKPAAKPKSPVKAKTIPSVRAKAKIPPKKIIINKEPGKLPVAINKNEHAEAVPGARELEMISEINSLRRDPKAYIPFVEGYMKLNDKNKELQVAAKELIKQLKTLQPLPQLALNPVMYSEAKQFGLSLKEQDEINHSDLPYFENLSLGHPDIKDAILDLLVDDGITDRGHRRNLLNPAISRIAVYEVPGEVQGYSNCYIQLFK